MMATMRYVQEGVTDDVSDAVGTLLSDNVLARVDPVALAGPDEFRSEQLYRKEVDDVLRLHEPSLRVIFGALQQRSGPAKKLLTFAAWSGFLRLLEFIHADLSDRDATLAFVWSRTCVTEPHTERGRVRSKCLPFEGFMEAITRVACLKALPTDELLSSSGVAHAGLYMADLRRNHPAVHSSFLEERRTVWGQSPKQPVERCLHHCLCLIVHTIEVSVSKSGGENLQVSESEMTRFLTVK